MTDKARFNAEQQHQDDFIEIHGLICGFCSHFPGDGELCPKREGERVSFEVKACNKWHGNPHVDVNIG